MAKTKNRFEIVKEAEPLKPWHLQYLTTKEESAFKATSAQFGDSLDATTAYFLNCWIRTPNGTRWLIDEIREDSQGFDTDADLSELSKMIVAVVKPGVLKRAAREFGGDVKQAIVESVREQMVVFGLPIFY